MKLDDDALRGHLARRARDATGGDVLVQSVVARVGRIEQPSAWRTWWSDRAPAIGAAGIVAVAVVVAGIALAAPPANPGASTEPGAIAGYPERRALTADELTRLVAGTPSGLWGSGAHVVADVGIVREPIPCDYGATSIPCPTGYLAGVEPRVLVTESIALLVDDDLSPPFLFQLRPEWPGSLFAVGEVASAPDSLAWTLAALIEHKRTLGPDPRPPDEVFLVDAWLVQTDAVYRCVPPTGDVDHRFACGDAAWLAPTGDRAVDAPLGSVRVQNAALQLFGRGPAPRQPERAVFAVTLEEPSRCFQCPPGGAVRIVARVDPVDVPAETTAVDGLLPAELCDATTWPATVISCATAFRIGSQAGARVERARIWLSTLGAVKSAMDPARQVSEPAGETAVWVIVYDGRWRCCPNAFDEFGNRIPQVTQSRWLVVAEAGREGSSFVYLQDWSDRSVPARLPGPNPTLSPNDLELESAPPDGDFDATTTASIVASARKGAIFLEPPVLTHRLVAAQVRRDRTTGGAVVVFHDYDGGGVVVTDMRDRGDGWIWTDVRHETAVAILSAWELARMEAAIRADPRVLSAIPSVELIADQVASPCGPRTGFCASATVHGRDRIGRSAELGVLVDLFAPSIAETLPSP